jgi:hypothetical protein
MTASGFEPTETALSVSSRSSLAVGPGKKVQAFATLLYLDSNRRRPRIEIAVSVLTSAGMEAPADATTRAINFSIRKFGFHNLVADINQPSRFESKRKVKAIGDQLLRDTLAARDACVAALRAAY